MQFFSNQEVKLPKLNNPQNVLQTFKKIQFIAQFFVFSRYSQGSDDISEILLCIQAFKYYYKMAHFAQQHNVYIEKDQQRHQESDKKVLKPLQKMSQLLQKIKSKPFQNQYFQSQQVEELACGKKLQLITSVPVPQQLKRTRLNFTALLGEVLNLLRPLLSILAIRIFGLNSYKSYMISLVIDLFVLLILQRNIVVSNKAELQELQERKKEILMRYLFRKPLFLLLRRFLIQPCIQKLIRKDRFIYKIILSLFDMQSSITLTL